MKNKLRFATSFKLAMGSALLFAASGALAQNAVIGKQLYETPRNPAYLSCSEATQCHGTSIAQNKNKIRNGTDPNKIISATELGAADESDQGLPHARAGDGHCRVHRESGRGVGARHLGLGHFTRRLARRWWVRTTRRRARRTSR